MHTDSEHRPIDGGGSSIVKELELTDLDIDQQLLALPGTSLLVFTSVGCSSCRWARQQLPGWNLSVDRVCWIDAGHNGGAVARYGVFHLPALFVVCEGQFHGQLQTRLMAHDLDKAVNQALTRTAEELP
ncbi:thioredoxin [Pseudomonas yamanorum]|nr:thioredoxin [Pseudomonas yamanorum]